MGQLGKLFMNFITRSRASFFGRKWLLLGICVVVLLIVTGAAYAVRHRPVHLMFSAWVAANPDPHGCLGATGIYAELDARMPKPPESAAAYQEIAKENRPTDIWIQLGQTSYPLIIDQDSSVIGNEQVDWAFRPVSLRSTSAASRIHVRATIRYTLNGRPKTATTIVEDGRCQV
jgi:hypothetical protein